MYCVCQYKKRYTVYMEEEIGFSRPCDLSFGTMLILSMVGYMEEETIDFVVR